MGISDHTYTGNIMSVIKIEYESVGIHLKIEVDTEEVEDLRGILELLESIGDIDDLR